MNDDTNTVSGQRLSQARRIVLKIGSSLLVDQSSGALHREWLEGLCTDIVALREQDKEVVVVSSGAVALGAERLGIDVRRARLADHQAPPSDRSGSRTHTRKCSADSGSRQRRCC
jgi:glutamate 5-kinase